MKKASDVIWPAATDQKEVRKCKKERIVRLVVQIGREECVFQQDSQCLHHVTTHFWYSLDIEGR